MTQPDDFRSRFRAFAGAKTYRRFVKALHHNPNGATRLRYWQQDLWDAFIRCNADCDIPIPQLAETLNICELHETELVPVDVPVFRGHIDYMSEYIHEMAATFPHSTVNEVMVSDSYEGSSAMVWVCSDCDRVRDASKWKNS